MQAGLKLSVCTIGSALAFLSVADTMRTVSADIVWQDGRKETRGYSIEEKDGRARLHVPAAEIGGGTKWIEIRPYVFEGVTVPAGDWRRFDAPLVGVR